MSKITTKWIADDAVTAAKVNADVAGLGLTQAAGGELDVNVDDSTLEVATDTLQVKDLGITTAKINSQAVTAAKLGSDVAGNGLGGGSGTALTVQADATGGANLARAINVSANGVAVKIDDTTIGEDGSQRLQVKNNSISSVQIDETDDYTWTGTHDFTGGTVHVPTPTATTHPATKAYVDEKVYGMTNKGVVKALADSNQTLSGLPTSIDGVTSWSDGDKILLTNQTSGDENGIWVVHTGSWTRPDNFAAGDGASGAYVWVDQGASYQDQRWTCTTDAGSDVIDTDSLTFEFDGGLANITAGTGLTKTGNTLHIGDGSTGDVNGINRGADNISVAVDNTTLEISSDQVIIKDGGVSTDKLAATSVTAAKLGSDVAGNGLTGGNGSALAVQADATGGANLATVVNVSSNGVAVKIDDSTIGENVGNQLEIKDDGVVAAKLNDNVAGEGLTRNGTTKAIDLDIDGLSAETTIADADEFVFYDASATEHKKITKANLWASINSEAKQQAMHLVTSGEITAGYFSLPSTPTNAQCVSVTPVGGPQQVNKQVVGATGATPDFDVLNSSECHINNNGAASGLSGDIEAGDVLIIEYSV